MVVVAVVLVVVVVVVVVVSSSSAVFLIEIVVVLLFCRNWTFELVVDCMRAGLEKKRGVEGGRSPAEPLPFAKVLAFRQAKALKKRLRSISSSNK